MDQFNERCVKAGVRVARQNLTLNCKYLDRIKSLEMVSSKKGIVWVGANDMNNLGKYSAVFPIKILHSLLSWRDWSNPEYLSRLPERSEEKFYQEDH